MKHPQFARVSPFLSSGRADSNRNRSRARDLMLWKAVSYNEHCMSRENFKVCISGQANLSTGWTDCRFTLA